MRTEELVVRVLAVSARRHSTAERLRRTAQPGTRTLVSTQPPPSLPRRGAHRRTGRNARARGRGCISPPVIDLHAGDDTETTVHDPNALADVKRTPLPVWVRPDAKDRFASRPYRTAGGQRRKMDVLRLGGC